MKTLNLKAAAIVTVLYFMPALSAIAQDYSGDAFRFSEQINPAGSARMRALGGNHSALGADAANITGNPAGLGFYSRSEFSMGLDYTSLHNNTSYIDTKTILNSGKMGLSNFAMIFGKGTSQVYSRSGWKASTFAIGYNRNSTLFNNFNFSAVNNRSSVSDHYAHLTNQNPNANGEFLDSDDQFDATNRVAYSPEALYYQMYLTEGDANGNAPFKRFDWQNPSPVRQTGQFESTGKTGQWTFATGTSYKDKLYLGLTGGIANLSYDFSNQYIEAFRGGKLIENLNNTQLLAVTGRGVNLSGGIIYRPNNTLRLGAELHSPTWYNISETFDERLSVKVNPTNTAQIPKDLAPASVAPYDFDYELRTPLRASAGAALFFGKAGFVTASAEYVAYNSMNLSAKTLSAQDNIDFSANNNQFIKTDYQNTLNLRLGAELRAGNAHLRAGAAYLPDPYKVRYNNIDRSKLQLSGGVGFRNSKYFFDLAGQYLAQKSAYTPYTLPNNEDYASALISSKQANFTLSLGAFFK
jgi:hypothetical protein